MNLSEKSIIVTGAASGLGFEFAARFLELGASVVATDVDHTKLKQASKRLSDKEHGGRFLATNCDVTDADQVASATKLTVDTFGRVDVLINNAGIGGLAPFIDLTVEFWNQVIATNLTGVFLFSQSVAREMIPRGNGRIVNISSISGVRAGFGRSAYGTAKAGVIQLTKQMAVELGCHGITANAVSPGPIDTPMAVTGHTTKTRTSYLNSIPLKRYGTPREIANIAAFLASDEASYINGQSIGVDGGFLAAGIMADDILQGCPS